MAQRGRSAAGAHQAARPAARATQARRRDEVDDGPGLRPQELAALRDRVRRLVEPVVAAEDLDLEELTISRAGRRYVVRITVDGDGGVGHDELSDVSREISATLDEAERTGGALTPDAYTLEVSSPGVDRPLTLPRHWRRNVGRLVKVKAGDRQLTARVLGVLETGVVFEGPAGEVAYPQLGPGRVQIEFNRLAELADEEFEEFATRAGDDNGELTDDEPGELADSGDEELEDET
jgi:ribosome maturation factor RimP